VKVINSLNKLLALTRRYDVPTDHTWSKVSINAQRTNPPSDAEIDAVIQVGKNFVAADELPPLSPQLSDGATVATHGQPGDIADDIRALATQAKPSRDPG